MRHLPRGGRYLRVADPAWEQPLDGGFAAHAGGGWNPPGSFGAVYLCRSIAVARVNVYRLLADQPYGPEDLEPASGPILVATSIPTDSYVDAVTARGLASIGLPASYPLDAHGEAVPRERREAIGQSAWESGEPGIACRSAAPTAPPRGEELAWFERGGALAAESTTPFDRWFW